MRLATVNLLGGRSVAHGDVVEDDLRAAAAMLAADVVGLQEVDRHQPRSKEGDQTEVVPEALEAPHWRFLPTLHGTPGGAWTPASGDGAGEQPPGPAYGIGLVSRDPVLAWQARRFKPAPIGLPLLVPGQGLVHVDDEPRAALAARVAAPGGSITVVVTHLSFVPGWNVAQLRAIARWARTLPGPHVLLGDLNLPGPVAGAIRPRPARRAADVAAAAQRGPAPSGERPLRPRGRGRPTLISDCHGHPRRTHSCHRPSGRKPRRA